MDTKSTIWGRVALGDKDAYADLFRDLFKRLYNYGKKFTADEDLLKDVAQDTLLVIWQKKAELKSVDYPETYSFSIFRNTLLTRLRKNMQYVSGSDVEGEPEFGIDHFIIQKEADAQNYQQIKQAIATLTSRQREAIFLRFYEGLPYEEVAEALGITTKATYKIVARALTELRQQLKMPGIYLLLMLAELRPEKNF